MRKEWLETKASALKKKKTAFPGDPEYALEILYT